MKFPEIETLLALFQRGEVTEQRLTQLLDKHTSRNDRSATPSRKATQTFVLWCEP